MAKKIGVLGSGTVAQILADGFVKHGYEVKMGTRDAKKLEEFAAKSGGKIAIGSFADAAAFGEIVVLAVKGKAAPDVLKRAGDAILKGKTIIDPTNPIEDAPPENGVLKFYSSLNRSQMENLQAAYPEAHFVKAFSMIGGPHMVNPEFSATPTMFICGNDPAAKKSVSGILTQFGFEPEDMGAATAARAIEPLCRRRSVTTAARQEYAVSPRQSYATVLLLRAHRQSQAACVRCRAVPETALRSAGRLHTRPSAVKSPGCPLHC